MFCVSTSGGHPAEGGPHALGWRLRHRVRHHRPGKLWGGGAAPEPPRGGEEAQKRAPRPRGQQVRSGPHPAGRHRGGRAPGGRNGVRLLWMFGMRQRGRRRRRGLSRAVPRGEAPQGRAGQGQAPQLHHARQTGHQQDADQDQQLGKSRATARWHRKCTFLSCKLLVPQWTKCDRCSVERTLCLLSGHFPLKRTLWETFMMFTSSMGALKGWFRTQTFAQNNPGHWWDDESLNRRGSRLSSPLTRFDLVIKPDGSLTTMHASCPV